VTWFWIDDGFSTHPKTLAIPPAHRLRVVGLWTLCGNWSAHHLTDGYVPAGLPAEYRAKKDDPQLLVDCRVRPGGAGLWEPHPDGGWVFHDWADWQKTKEEIEARRALRAAAGRKGGKASGTTRRANSTPKPGSKRGALASPSVRQNGSNDEATAKQVLRESFDSGEANANPSPARRGPGPEGAPARPAPEGPPDPPARPGPAAPGAVAAPAVAPLRSAPPEPPVTAPGQLDVRLTGEIITVLGALMPEQVWERLDHAAIDGLADRLAAGGWTRTSITAALEQRHDTLVAARGPGLAMTVLRDLARITPPATSPGCPNRCDKGWLDADTNDRPRPCPHCRPASARRVAQQQAQTYDHGPRSPGREAS
jgi:hypothetical protein